MKKTLKLGFGRRPYNISNCVLNISSYLANIKLHTEDQPPSQLNSGDSYEEDLKIRIWKTTLQYFVFFLSIFLIVRLKASCMPKISFLGALEVELFGDCYFCLGGITKLTHPSFSFEFLLGWSLTKSCLHKLRMCLPEALSQNVPTIG